MTTKKSNKQTVSVKKDSIGNLIVAQNNSEITLNKAQVKTLSDFFTAYLRT